jgi:hypothetical protein
MYGLRLLRRVALVWTEVSEELIAPIIKVTGIGKLGSMLAVASNRSTLLSPAQTMTSWVRISLRGKDVRVRLFCFCFLYLRCPMYVAAMRLADPPCKESYRLSVGLKNWSETSASQVLCQWDPEDQAVEAPRMLVPFVIVYSIITQKTAVLNIQMSAWIMSSSATWRRVGLVITEVSKKTIASSFRGDLGRALTVTIRILTLFLARRFFHSW